MTATNTMEIKHHRARLSGVDMHYVTAGDPKSEPLLLVHGYPRSWFEWRHIIPLLASRYRIIAPDLRGSGDSSKPPAGFDKRTMSHDLVELMDKLGIGKVHVIGRDWGAPTALAFALHWERARTLTYIENLVPGFGMEEAVRPITSSDQSSVIFQTGGVNHFTFHLIPDLPEMLVQGREREYFSWFLSRIAYNTGAIDEAVINECVRCLSMPGALRATFGYSRAIYQDGEDNRAAIAAKGKMSIPVLALGAEHSVGDRCGESISLVAQNVEAELIPDCGHWATDEQPAWIAERVLRFLSRHA